MIRVNLGDRIVGEGHRPLVVAELSANHAGSLEHARRVVRAAAAAGADAIKTQTYTADTLTIDCDRPPFVVGEGSPWAGRTLYDLYREAHTPWEWQAPLQEEAAAAGLLFFSTPFDATAVDLLEGLDVPAYKIASFEIVDLALLEAVARTGKPVVLSTGMASQEEIRQAVDTVRAAGSDRIVLLKCTSAYPAPPDEMNLLTLGYLAETFRVPVGLSDHTMGTAVAAAAVALGACLVEKHVCLSRAEGGPDSSFSLEPPELRELVTTVRQVHAALGRVSCGRTDAERASLVFRRSLFVVEDVAAGEPFTAQNVRSIRPGHGLSPRELPRVLGRRAAGPIQRGTPLRWDLVAGGEGGRIESRGEAL